MADIPGATVRIVGANPAADVVALAGPRVTVTGYVDDLRPHFVQAGVLACPIRIGTGLKTKVLQAMALRTPVVASTPAKSGHRGGRWAAPADSGRSESVRGGDRSCADAARMSRPTAAARPCVRRRAFFGAGHGQLPGRIHQRRSQQGGGPAECRPTGRRRREYALKALVTGGAGFIGSNLVKVLVEHGHDVSVLDNLTSGYRENLAYIHRWS